VLSKLPQWSRQSASGVSLKLSILFLPPPLCAEPFLEEQTARWNDCSPRLSRNFNSFRYRCAYLPSRLIGEQSQPERDGTVYRIGKLPLRARARARVAEDGSAARHQHRSNEIRLVISPRSTPRYYGDSFSPLRGA